MRERRRYHEPRRYAAQRQRQGRRSSSAPGYLLSACLIGALAGGGWSLTDPDRQRSEEHTSELQSLMRISYDVFCLKKTRTQRRDTDQSGLHITEASPTKHTTRLTSKL